MEGHDAQRTYQSPVILPNHLRLLFEHEEVRISLAFSDDTLYGFSGGPQRTSIRLLAMTNSGHIRWTHRTCAEHPCSYFIQFGVSPRGNLIGITQGPRDNTAVLAIGPGGDRL